MSSRCRIELVLAALLALAGCHKQEQAVLPLAQGPDAVPVSALIPAGGALPKDLSHRAMPYYDNADAVMKGKQLYNAMNCVGCHANGGGAIGPALMDDVWIYGGRLDQIYATIYQGRPNGMPAWGGKIPDEQMWQIAAYVRSMSLPATIAATGGGTTPSQHPAAVPRDADRHGGWQLPEGTVVHTP
jgi:cytochrome c oxidase cbb3-type subunit 3